MDRYLSRFISLALLLVPFAALAYFLATAFGSGRPDFWKAFEVVVAGSIFFRIMDGIGNSLAWRLHDRRQVVRQLVAFFGANSFPPRDPNHVLPADFSTYACRVEADPHAPQSAKNAIASLNLLATVAQSRGMIAEARFHKVTDMALDVYSPPDR